MSRLIAFILKHPKISIIIVLSLVTTVGGYMGYNAVVISRLETRVAQLEKSIASKDSQISSLVSSVDRQNAQVNEWKAKAESRAQAAHEAMREAEKAKQAADEAVGRIQAANAMTCQEGVDLIDRELWQ